MKKDTWGLESGSNSGSRWGIKGSEQISENITVGFQLEQGFNADAGDYADDDRFFNRESRLYVQTPFGEIGMGRMGALDSGLGSYDLMEAASAFGTGWGTIGASPTILRGMGDRMDNTITYKSPQFGGVTVLAQVSLSPNSYGVESSSNSDRYYALGAKGQWNALEAALVVSTTDYARPYANLGDGFPDNSKVVTGYVAYDCGFAKTTLGAQYYDDMRKAPIELNLGFGYIDEVLNEISTIFATKGYGVMLSTTVPLAGGEFLASMGYADYELTLASDCTYDAFNFGIGYQYPLSKRTFVYAGAGYTKVSGDMPIESYKIAVDNKTIEVVSGLVHTF